jgi:hypothetical protein
LYNIYFIHSTLNSETRKYNDDTTAKKYEPAFRRFKHLVKERKIATPKKQAEKTSESNQINLTDDSNKENVFESTRPLEEEEAVQPLIVEEEIYDPREASFNSMR